MVAPIPVQSRCYRCGGAKIERVYYEYSPGRSHVTDWCNDCNNIASGKNQWIRKDLAGEITRTIHAQSLNVPCCVIGCDKVAVDWHHFAPEHIFRKLHDKFPVLPLCGEHHVLWHEGMAWHDVDSCKYCRGLRDKVKTRLRKTYE